MEDSSEYPVSGQWPMPTCDQNRIWDHFSFHFPSWAQELHRGSGFCHEWSWRWPWPWSCFASCHRTPPGFPASYQKLYWSPRMGSTCISRVSLKIWQGQGQVLRDSFLPSIFVLLPSACLSADFPLSTCLAASWSHLSPCSSDSLIHSQASYPFLLPSPTQSVSLTVHLTHHLPYSSLYCFSLSFFSFLPVCPLLVSSFCYKNLPWM